MVLTLKKKKRKKKLKIFKVHQISWNIAILKIYILSIIYKIYIKKFLFKL